jgi:competence ComEA-like helix-hairpin-helix protein
MNRKRILIGIALVVLISMGSASCIQAGGIGGAPLTDGSKPWVNLNSATVRDLTTVPGIDENLANTIIMYRELNGFFHAVNDLLLIPGIDEQKMNSIRDYLYTGVTPSVPEPMSGTQGEAGTPGQQRHSQ